MLLDKMQGEVFRACCFISDIPVETILQADIVDLYIKLQSPQA